MKMYTHKQFNRLLDENEYNDLPDFVKPLYELYGTYTDNNNDGREKMTIDMRERNNINPGKNISNTATNSIAGQNNTGTYPEPGQTWVHYKGGKYEIIAMCNHTTTNEVLVIYRSLSFNGFHARPYSEWHDEIWVDGNCKTRFILIAH